MTLKLRVLLLLVLSGAWVATALAQDASALGNRFFSATITRNEKPLLMPIIFRDSQDNLIVKGAPLADVIRRAHGLERYQVVDGPEWIHTPHLYDIEAVPPPAALIASDEAAMLKALLADRFSLQVELVTRDDPVWVLTLGTDTTKLVPLAQDVPQTYVPPRPYASLGVRSTQNIAAFTRWLAQTIEQPVLNLTGLSGRFDIRIEPFDPEDPSTLAGPLWEKYGLIFEKRPRQMEQLLITSIEHPQLDQGNSD